MKDAQNSFFFLKHKVAYIKLLTVCDKSMVTSKSIFKLSIQSPSFN